MADRKEVYYIKEGKDGKKSFWTKIGVAFVNKDGSLNVFLDAIPMDGKLHIRDAKKRDEYDQSQPSEPQGSTPSGSDIPF